VLFVEGLFRYVREDEVFELPAKIIRQQVLLRQRLCIFEELSSVLAVAGQHLLVDRSAKFQILAVLKCDLRFHEQSSKQLAGSQPE
jgi:hypothetical protein